MNVPAPLILLVVLMIGYPLVQMSAIWLRRPKRLRFNQLSEQMLTDPRFDADEKRVVQWFQSESRGALYTLTSPLTFSAIVFQSATKSRRFRPWIADMESCDKNETTPIRKIWHDARLRELGELSVQLELLTYPITTVVTALAASLTWMIAAVIMLFRGSLPARLSIRELASASGYSSSAF